MSSLRARLAVAADRIELLGMGALHPESHMALLREAAGECRSAELHAYRCDYVVNGDEHSVEVQAFNRSEALAKVDAHMYETHGTTYPSSVQRDWQADAADRRVVVAPGDVPAHMAAK